MLRAIQKIFHGVSDVCFGLSFAALAFITLLVNTDVFSRLLFHKSITWTTEISEALLLYMTFLGAEKVLRENKHVKVDLLTNRVSDKTGRILSIISACIGLIVSLFFVVFGTMTAWSYYKRGIYNPSATELPLAPVIAIIPFGGILLSYEFLRKIVINLKTSPQKGLE
jgi:TRAP-type C4-dicarboxylate transport system permease small subunit